MPDMLASMYFKTEVSVMGRLFKFQPDVIYSYKQYGSVLITNYSFTHVPV